MHLIFIRVLRDSTPRYVGQSVGQLVGRSVGWVMARKGKDTDVTVTVKTEEEWNKLIESEVASLLPTSPNNLSFIDIPQIKSSHTDQIIAAIFMRVFNREF